MGASHAAGSGPPRVPGRGRDEQDPGRRCRVTGRADSCPPACIDCWPRAYGTDISPTLTSACLARCATAGAAHGRRGGCLERRLARGGAPAASASWTVGRWPPCAPERTKRSATPQPQHPRTVRRGCSVVTCAAHCAIQPPGISPSGSRSAALCCSCCSLRWQYGGQGWRPVGGD